MKINQKVVGRENAEMIGCLQLKFRWPQVTLTGTSSGLRRSKLKCARQLSQLESIGRSVATRWPAAIGAQLVWVGERRGPRPPLLLFTRNVLRGIKCVCCGELCQCREPEKGRQKKKKKKKGRRRGLLKKTFFREWTQCYRRRQCGASADHMDMGGKQYVCVCVCVLMWCPPEHSSQGTVPQCWCSMCSSRKS